MIKRLTIFIVLAAVLVWLLGHAASFLVIDEPRKSDVILVLGGSGDETRFLHAVELLKQGYASHILVDAQTNFTVFGRSEAELAQEYVERHLPGEASVCPNLADSTYEEAADAKKCLDETHASSVLIVTSDYHTRRASSIFRTRLPGHEISIAAAGSQRWFSSHWWERRRWAKTVLDEWEKLIWWELVDRWRAKTALE